VSYTNFVIVRFVLIYNIILSFSFQGFSFYHKRARKSPLNVILISYGALNTNPLFFLYELVSKVAILIG
jgi:hypothetical protein